MISKQITLIFLAFIAILGWNAFLIKRDAELYKATEREITLKEKYCQKQAGWHPDCNVK